MFLIQFLHMWWLVSIWCFDVLEYSSSTEDTVHLTCILIWYLTVISHSIFFLLMTSVKNVHNSSLSPNHKEMNSILPWLSFLSFLDTCSFDFKNIIRSNYIGFVILSLIHLFMLWIFLTRLVHFLNVCQYHQIDWIQLFKSWLWLNLYRWKIKNKS